MEWSRQSHKMKISTANLLGILNIPGEIPAVFSTRALDETLFALYSNTLKFQGSQDVQT